MKKSLPYRKRTAPPATALAFSTNHSAGNGHAASSTILRGAVIFSLRIVGGTGAGAASCDFVAVPRAV